MEETSTNLKNYTILVIDDDKQVAELIADSCKSFGYNAIFATDPKKGIMMAKRYQPDLILLDIVMPQLDGFQVLELLKTDSKTLHIPVMMVSARGEESYKRKAASLYDEDYITKPFDYDELKTRIQKVLTRRNVC